MKKLFPIMFATAFAFPALANNAHHHGAQLTPMQQDLMEGMASMHDDMMQGAQHTDADIAFAASMIPHHQGAVKMAEVELKYGKDPELRKLAQAIIDAQQGEIEFMQQWLKKQGK